MRNTECIELYLEQIEACLQEKLYLPALASALSLPDICAALESDNGESSGTKYQKWYDEYGRKYCSKKMTSKQAYQFRCRMLHQGSSQIDKNDETIRVCFFEPSESTDGITAHDNSLGDSLNIDIQKFCNGMIKAVREWLKNMETNENVQKNLDKNFIKRVKDGLCHFISFGDAEIYVIK